jgi:ABC-2 type transport system ATP-binding protein
MYITVLKTKNLTKRYGGTAAVDDVSLTVEQGDLYGLIGQNGAGKTALMRMITALAKPTGGEIELFGVAKPAVLAKARQHMGSIIETSALYHNLSAAQNLEYTVFSAVFPTKQLSPALWKP